MPKKIYLYNAELFAEIKKLGKRANQRIVRLEREFGKDKWAVKQLRNHLDRLGVDAWTETGRVKYNKSMTSEQMRIVKKFLEKFLSPENKASTKKGIKEIRKNQIEAIRKRYNREISDKEFSYEDAENIYQIFESSDYSWIYEYFTPSEFDTLVLDAIDDKASLNDWFDLLVMYSPGFPINDLDIQAKCEVLYNKFVLLYI